MGSPMEVTEAIKPLDGKRKSGYQPVQQQAVGVMMRDVLQFMLALGFIKALVLDLPAALGHAKQRACADLLRREVGQPICFDQGSVGLVLAIIEDAHGGPAQTLPRIEVIGIPDLDAIFAEAKAQFGSLLGKPLLSGCP